MTNEVARVRLDIIKQELGMVQSSVDKYDDINFRIRGWEVTIWSALMVVFFQSGKAVYKEPRNYFLKCFGEIFVNRL